MLPAHICVKAPTAPALLLESSPEPRMSPSMPVPNACAGEHVCANASANHDFSRNHLHCPCPRPFWGRQPPESTPKHAPSPATLAPEAAHTMRRPTLAPKATQCVANAHATAHAHAHPHNIRAQRNLPPARQAPKASLPVAAGTRPREPALFHPSIHPHCPLSSFVPL